MARTKTKGYGPKGQEAATDGATHAELSQELEQPAAQTVTPPKGDAEWWFDARGLKEADADVVAAANETNCTAMLLDLDQKWAQTGKQKIVAIDRAEQLDRVAPGAWVFTPHEGLVPAAQQAGRKVGCFVEVKDMLAEFPHCVQVAKRGYDFVVIDIHDATYIPYELLLAETEKLTTRVMRSVPIAGLVGTVDDVNQSLNAFATMEQGVGAVFRSRNVKDIQELSSKIKERRPGTMELVEAEVIDVQHTGLGHRACVDTTTLMTAEQGMIVGSTGWGGIFVCSETHFLPHMNLREFRCNAGGVHSYIWGPNDRHIYLSEVQAGTEVLAVDIHGRTRVVTVGRVKIERRPLILIKCRVRKAGEEIFINTFLQNDWHVRVMRANGTVHNSTLVKPGDKLLAHIDRPGRHTGLRVTENIVEK